MKDDPVEAIELANKIIEMSSKLKGMTPNMVMTALTPNGMEQSHPMDDVDMIVSNAKGTLYSKYGEMMFEAPDGPVLIKDRPVLTDGEHSAIRESHSKEHVPSVSTEVSSKVSEELTDAIHPEAIENGLGVLGRLGKVERKRGR